MLKKLLISLLLLSLLCAALSLSVSASEEGYVFDLRGVFDEVLSLNAEADTIRQVTGISPYFIITEDQGGLNAEEYVDQFVLQHGFYGDAVVVLDGETSYYIAAYGAAADRLSEDDLIALRDTYSESETYFDGVRGYFNLLFTTVDLQIPPAEELPQTTDELWKAPDPSDDVQSGIAPMPAEAVPGGEETSEHSHLLVDSGELLTADEETRIAALLEEYSETHDADIVIVTEKTLGGTSAQAYADDYFDYNGYREDGILLLLCPNEGERYISMTGKAIRWFEDNNFYTLTDAIIPQLDRGDYADGFTTYAKTCDEIIADETAFPWGMLVIAILIGALLSYLIPMNIFKGDLKSVRSKAEASDYVRPNSMVLTQNQDIFLYFNVTKTPKPKDTSRGGGGTHVGSSGTSHGGGSF